MVDITILDDKKKRSFFNILEPHIVKVEITMKDNVKEEYHEKQEDREIKNIQDKKDEVEISEVDLKQLESKLGEFLRAFLFSISEKLQYTVKVRENMIDVKITGEEASSLIGYRGETLNALQTILSSVVNRETETNIKVLVDIENYREKRKKTLEELSDKIEKTVTKTGKQVTLEPMPAYERKIIHSRLQESRTVRTYSVGEEPHRKVVVSKK